MTPPLKHHRPKLFRVSPDQISKTQHAKKSESTTKRSLRITAPQSFTCAPPGSISNARKLSLSHKQSTSPNAKEDSDSSSTDFDQVRCATHRDDSRRAFARDTRSMVRRGDTLERATGGVERVSPSKDQLDDKFLELERQFKDFEIEFSHDGDSVSSPQTDSAESRVGSSLRSCGETLVSDSAEGETHSKHSTSGGDSVDSGQTNSNALSPMSSSLSKYSSLQDNSSDKFMDHGMLETTMVSESCSTSSGSKSAVATDISQDEEALMKTVKATRLSIQDYCELPDPSLESKHSPSSELANLTTREAIHSQSMSIGQRSNAELHTALNDREDLPQAQHQCAHEVASEVVRATSNGEKSASRDAETEASTNAEIAKYLSLSHRGGSSSQSAAAETFNFRPLPAPGTTKERLKGLLDQCKEQRLEEFKEVCLVLCFCFQFNLIL